MPPVLLGIIKRKIKLFLTVLFISVITLAPFIARNIITSGYVIFPSTSIDIANVDWKYNPELTRNEKNYITAYAKNPGVVTKEEINAVNKMSPAEWLPGWWQRRSTADKIIMIFLLLSFSCVLLSVKKILISGFVTLLALVTLLTGIIFWFVNAPDPRFGFGSILGFIGVVSYLVLKEKEIVVGKKVLIVILLFVTGSIIAYTGYRFINFFNKEQFLTPFGIQRSEYETFECDRIKFNSPVENKEFGITPVPCTDLDCKEFSPRGNKIEDGFRTK